MLVLSFPIAVLAQSEQAITGTLRVEINEERTPVAGVDISVVQGGEEVGVETTAEDGTFAVTVPGDGAYSVTLNTDSLPEGVTLQADATETLEVRVESGNNKAVIYRLVSGDQGETSAFSDQAGKVARLVSNGVRFGLIMAMCSIGLSLIFGTTQLVNFAHGELVTFGAVMALVLDNGTIPFLVAAALALALAAGFGAANDLVIWRPLRKRGTGLISMMVISIGLSILIRFVILWQVGGDRQAYSKYRIQEGIEIGPLSLTPRDLIAMAISIVVLVAVAYMINKTKFGKAMRAVADNRDLAESSGINVQQVILYVWVLGGLLAGLGGILLGLDQQVRWNMGFDLLLLIFAAVTLGGLGTAYGALVGSLVVGIFIELSTLVVAPELKSVGALMILIIILLVRPQGILGRAERVG